MLRKLRISQFQCHERLEIDLDEFINCFVGASDVGKSTVLRALRWLATNRPAGLGFLKSGAQRMAVRLDAEDSSVLRYRGKRRNGYKLNNRIFKALGAAGVPGAVTQALNISEDSFQLQHDPPFWLTLSPGQVARKLNQIVDLSLIDHTLGNLARELRQAQTTVQVSEERLTSYTQQEKQLRWTLAADEKLTKLEKLEKWIAKKQDEVAQLQNLAQRAEKASVRLQEAARERQEAQELLQALERYRALRKEQEELQELISRWERCQSNLEKNRQQLTEAKDRIEALRGQACPVCGQSLMHFAWLSTKPS